MVEVIAKAADIPRLVVSSDPFTEPTPKRHAVIVGGTHLRALSHLHPAYAVETTVIVPSQLALVDREVEIERAVQYEDTYPELCRGVGQARDLSGIDSDTADYLIVCTPYAELRDQFLSQAWRVVKEFGKIIVFTPNEIPPTYLARFGIANPTYYAAEGFYLGTLRKISSIYARN